jgi:hypothetical protein
VASGWVARGVVRAILRHPGQKNIQVLGVGVSIVGPLDRRTGKGSRCRQRPPQPSRVSFQSILQSTGDSIMRVMVMVKASKASEAGVMPSQQLLADMGRYNEELVKAGIMLAGEGLQPSSKGARMRFAGASRTVIDGPFAETKELVAGFWLWQVRSMDEAIEWLRRCPNPHLEDCEVEIRPVFEADDFGPALTPELREQEDRLRAQVAANKH